MAPGAELAAAWERTEALKAECMGQGPIEDLATTLGTGEHWVRTLFERHGLGEADIDACADAVMKLAADTEKNLNRLYLLGEVDPPLMAKALVAAGFTNGLAAGLELARERHGG